MTHADKKMLSFFLTTKCNLDCIYCYTNKYEHKNQTISFEFAKKGVDYYYNECIVKQGFPAHIRFFGAGEPTSEIELIKEICKYSDAKFNTKSLKEIQTNGCFSDEVCDWLSENIDVIWVSCDGTPEVQDYNRPFYKSDKKSSKVMEKNIKKMVADGKTMVGIRTTITRNNMSSQKENIDYYNSLGIKNVWVDPIFPSVGDEINNENTINMDKFPEEFVDAVKYAKQKGMFYGSILTCNFNGNTNIHCRACHPVPHLTTDGYISACDMALFGEDKKGMDCLIYGRWNKEKNQIDIDEEKVEYIKNRTCDNMKHCKKCDLRYKCGGYCLGEVLNETGNLYGKKPYVCKAIREIYNNLPEELIEYTYSHP